MDQSFMDWAKPIQVREGTKMGPIPFLPRPATALYKILFQGLYREFCKIIREVFDAFAPLLSSSILITANPSP